MEKCKLCGFEGKLEGGKCGFCQREKGVPGGDRLKQAIKELPWQTFTLNTATETLPYYFSYTVKLLKRLEMLDFLETSGDSPKEYKLTNKAFKYLDLKIQPKKAEDDSVRIRRKKNKFNSEGWKKELEGIVKSNPGCSINDIEVDKLGKKQIYAYLKELVDEKVIYTQINPTDKRKKIYFHEETRKAEYPPEESTPEVKEPEIPSKPEFPSPELEGVKVEMVDTSMPTIGQLLDMVWPQCKNATPRKPTNLKNQGFEALVAQFHDQKSLLDVYNGLPEPLQENTQITLDPQNKKHQLIIPMVGAEA